MEWSCCNRQLIAEGKCKMQRENHTNPRGRTEWKEVFAIRLWGNAIEDAS